MSQPMHESEAREFIKAEVNRLLWTRLLALVSGLFVILGVPSVVAVFNAWSSLNRELRESVNSKVRTEVVDATTGEMKHSRELVNELLKLVLKEVSEQTAAAKAAANESVPNQRAIEDA